MFIVVFFAIGILFVILIINSPQWEEAVFSAKSNSCVQISKNDGYVFKYANDLTFNSMRLPSGTCLKPVSGKFYVVRQGKVYLESK